MFGCCIDFNLFCVLDVIYVYGGISVVVCVLYLI